MTETALQNEISRRAPGLKIARTTQHVLTKGTDLLDAPRKENPKMGNIYENPGVKAALKSGRQPDDIAILACPGCGELGYYNQGSWFNCVSCKRSYHVVTQDEADDDDYGATRTLVLDECMTLADIDSLPENYP